MILIRILEHDLHRARQGVEAVPHAIEIPAKESHLPAIISNSHGGFIPTRWFTKPGQRFGNLANLDPLRGGGIMSGVFLYNSDKLDDLLDGLMLSALDLSRSEGWPNVFTEGSIAENAFNYIEKSSPSGGQPHVCLIPASWKDSSVKKWFGSKNMVGAKYKKYCKIIPTKISFPVFCSRPDFVGMYTQFMGGGTSILLHNVKLGLGFCPMSS